MLYVCERCRKVHIHSIDLEVASKTEDTVSLEPCSRCLLDEYDKARSEGYEEGYEKARSEGQEEGYEKGYDEGYREGYREGYDEG